jgi:DNA-binding response OmpR family regulator
MTKVLVEDEQTLAWALQRMLEGRGYVVVGCSDTGDGALRMAQERQPDVVLIDVRLSHWQALCSP